MQEDYHLLVDSIKDYAVYMLDKKGCIATWNAGAERMKGYTEKEVIGTYYNILFLPEDREKGKPEIELHTALDKGRFEEEGWRMRKDGTKFWANVILRPVFSETKEHVGYAKVTRDLTEKKRNEELYLLLVSQVKEYAIFMLDTTGHILTWNEGAERIKGYSASDIIGKHFSQFYMAEDKASGKPQRELEIAIRTGKYEEEGWRIRKDGTVFWANVVITPIYADRHIGFAKVTRDLTTRKEMEHIAKANAILEATNKELERFAYTASHDLKEPLRKIISFSTLVSEDKSITGKSGEYLAKVTSSARRMDRMIEDILNFSTLTNKQHFTKCNLQELVSGTLELLEKSITERNAVVEYTELPDAIVIPGQMQQLFQNLISNSLKFSRKEETPRIGIVHDFIEKVPVKGESLWPSDRYLQLKIRDNGIGFEQDYAEKIFNLFDRLHGRGAYEGTGIGLAICKKIAENHGGTIWAKSEPGKGAEFTLVLPA
jgi:PAS domain S-box-containing protein